MSEKLKYYPIELHAHSNHSDSGMTVSELVNNAKDFGYKALFLTDHNTMSGHEEVMDKNLNGIIPVLKGVEWTTFYGHMTILGCENTGNWTEANAENLDECILKIKKNEDVAIGLAHPMSIGNPICSGCHWEFKVKDWNNIDYIEIFNSVLPQEVYWNELAYNLWLEKLLEGHKLSATSGRDWHMMEFEDFNVPLTYVGLKGDLNQENVVEAIRKGRIYATLGPGIDINYDFGDTIKEDEIHKFEIEFNKPELKGYERFNIQPKEIRIYNNEELLESRRISYGVKVEFSLLPKSGFIRFEVMGEIKGKENVRLVVTSPIYVD